MSYVIKLLWLGILDDVIIGVLYIKIIYLLEVKEYYFDYFGLE